MSGFMGVFYKISEWIMRFAFVNILWIGGTLLGLFILGFFPATAALFAVVRKWVMGDVDIPLFQTFLISYKKEFIKSNLIGVIFVIIGYVLYMDFNYLVNIENSTLKWLLLPLLGCSFFYVILLFYVFPVMVHYDINIRSIIKSSFLFTVSHPLSIIIMITGSFLLYFIMIRFPGFMLFFGGSILAFVITASSHQAFRKNELRREPYFENSE